MRRIIVLCYDSDFSVIPITVHMDLFKNHKDHFNVFKDLSSNIFI